MAADKMKTYQVDYYVHGVWNPGNIVKMEPKHLKYYLEFLNGERPLVAARGRGTIARKKDRCLPTRLRCIEPDWSQEDGYYVFNGMSQEYLSLAVHPRLMPKRPE